MPSPADRGTERSKFGDAGDGEDTVSENSVGKPPGLAVSMPEGAQMVEEAPRKELLRPKTAPNLRLQSC